VVAPSLTTDRARFDLTALAAGIRMVGEAIATASRSASREAHRNGTTAPDWITATNFISHGIDPARLDAVVVPDTTDDHGIDLITRAPDGRTTAFQIKSHQQRPGPPPALPAAPVPGPPPPTTAARAA
jgi:hypothetical protein